MQIRKFASLEEIRSIPGYVEHIGNIESQKPKFLGYYKFRDFIRCALRSCHTPHGFGYVAATEDGQVVAIGNVCGAELFGDLWEVAAAAFDKAVERHILELSLADGLRALPELLSRLDQLLDGPRGAKWLEQAEFSLRRVCPREVMTDLSGRIARRAATVSVTRMRTKNDPPVRGRDAPYIDEPKGSFQGLGALESPTARHMLDQLRPSILTFTRETAASLMCNRAMRNRFISWRNGIEPTLRMVETRLAEALLFFETDNLRLLSYAARSPHDREMLSRLVWNENTGRVEVSSRGAA